MARSQLVDLLEHVALLLRLRIGLLLQIDEVRPGNSSDAADGEAADDGRSVAT